MRVVAFGTYDAGTHPRVGVLIAGLRSHGIEVVECNVPLGLSTADRVRMLRQPWRIGRLAYRLVVAWGQLVARSRRLGPVDAVLVGYLGQFDIHLARRLFRGVPLVLDQLVFGADTAVDRGLAGGAVLRLLRWLDLAALRRADIIIVDTEENAGLVPRALRDRVVVVPVGATDNWFQAHSARTARDPESPMRVVFFGLFTPLQGAPVIGRAIADLPDSVTVTMIGSGQELAETRLVTGGRDVTWIPWVESEDLPEIVASHDVCLGIFGTGSKARRVVPNKVFQGMAAGCAVVTSDTLPQRRTLRSGAVFVSPGDPVALASALRELAGDRRRLLNLQRDAAAWAATQFAPHQVVRPLLARLGKTSDTGSRS